MQEILWNNNLVFDWLIHYGKIPEYPMMALIIIFSIRVLNKLPVGGLFQERVISCTKILLYPYYLVYRGNTNLFFQRER